MSCSDSSPKPEYANIPDKVVASPALGGKNTRILDYEVKAVGTIKISMLMNINRVSVDSIGNQGRQDLLFSDPSVSLDGRFTEELRVSFSFSSDTTNDGDIISGLEGNDVLIGWQGDDDIVGGGDRDTFYGGKGNDILTGTNDGDIMSGLEGNDVLIGLQGDDDIIGGDDSDILYGGKGADRLNGYFGNDILVGGTGKDEYSVAAGFGTDTILDFANSEDIVRLENLSFQQILISPGTNGTLIRVASSGEIIASLTGVAPNLLGSEDFIEDFITYVPIDQDEGTVTVSRSEQENLNIPAQHLTPVYRNGWIEASAIYGNGLPNPGHPFIEMVR